MALSFQDLANFIWSVADLLRSPYRPPQYERVMLPMTVLRRFDCVLEPTKEAVIKRWQTLQDGKVSNPDRILNQVAGSGKDLGFHNHSELNFQRLKGDPDNIGRHLTDYIAGFSENIRKIFERFEFEKEIEKLEEANRLYLVVSKFAEIDLHPSHIDNITMGLIFEDLIRRFNEAANETAGDHFTPREVIRLMVNLLLEPDSHILTTRGVIVKICDPACGTGGMLSEAQNWIRQHNEDAHVLVYGQDYNPRSYAVAASDLLIKGHKDSRIEFGDTLTDDKFQHEHFDYLLANPPFRVDWKGQQKEVVREHDRGDAGRFAPKLPRVNDGALLFLLHMIAKFHPVQPEEKSYGSRCAIVFNGSPLFTGGAASGASEIRRWIIEHDWLEAIVALPEQMFYNTGIGTFIWVVTNHKTPERQGKIQLLDARERWTPMRRSLGDKRRYLADDTIAALTREHGVFQESDACKIFDNADFGYRRITVERPLRLRFQITDEAKEQFLDVCPEFLDTVLMMEQEMGIDPYDDWNEAWAEVQRIAKEVDIRWAAAQRKLFRECFATVDPEAKPVIAKRSNFTGAIGPEHFPGQMLLSDLEPAALDAIFGIYQEKHTKKSRAVQYESEPALRDYENVPLKEDIVSFFLREVRPFVPDAWISPEIVDEKDGGIGKIGYEINFNRVFFHYEPPRPLDEIDTELEEVKKHLLTLLQEVSEKRAALVSRTVTRGLDPNVLMKSSSLDWLGDIPLHWELRRLKFLTEGPLTYGANEAGLEDDPAFPRFVRITDIAEDGSLRDETFKSLPYELAEPYLLKEGDILFARSGTTVGKSFIYRPEWGVACYAGYLIRCRCIVSQLIPEFLYAFTLSAAYWQQVRARTIQATIQNFSAEKYGDIWIPLPPHDEQKQIVVHMKKALDHLDKVYVTTQHSIALLKERRSALITAAVTGQLAPETMSA